MTPAQIKRLAPNLFKVRPRPILMPFIRRSRIYLFDGAAHGYACATAYFDRDIGCHRLFLWHIADDGTARLLGGLYPLWNLGYQDIQGIEKDTASRVINLLEKADTKAAAKMLVAAYAKAHSIKKGT